MSNSKRTENECWSKLKLERANNRSGIQWRPTDSRKGDGSERGCQLSIGKKTTEARATCVSHIITLHTMNIELEGTQDCHVCAMEEDATQCMKHESRVSCFFGRGGYGYRDDSAITRADKQVDLLCLCLSTFCQHNRCSSKYARLLQVTLLLLMLLKIIILYTCIICTCIRSI